MPIKYKRREVAFIDVVSVDEAEGLLEWLQGKKGPTVNLSACTHVHPANVQVLLAAKIRVSAWPADLNLSSLLKTSLASNKKGE